MAKNVHTKALLAAILPKRPVLSSILKQAGNTSIGEYTKGFRKSTVVEPVISPSDLIQVVKNYTKETLGDKIADQAERTLQDSLTILTGDHFGTNNLALTLHGDFVFALSKKPTDCVIVFAGGGVPLDNFNYMRGLKLARENGRTARVNLFSKSQGKSLVVVAPKITTEMILKAEKQIKSLQISEPEKQAVMSILSTYKESGIQKKPNLAHQITQVNAKIWGSLFTPEARARIGNLVYLQMETIVTKLLETDVLNPESPAYKCFFDSNLRTKLIDRFDYRYDLNSSGKQGQLTRTDGQYGCWDTEKLYELLTKRTPDDWVGREKLDEINSSSAKPEQKAKMKKEIAASARANAMSNAGTMFFWGIDSRKRRVNLYLEKNKQKEILKGIDDAGNELAVEFTPEAITAALQKKQIIPNIFTAFKTISLLRGVKCYGGFMQTDYLTNIRNGVADAFEGAGRVIQRQPVDHRRSCTDKRGDEYINWSKKIREVPTENYATGPILAVAKYKDGSVKPAGAIEIIAKGGLTHGDLQKMRTMTLAQTNMLGLPEIYPKVCRPEERREELLKITAADITKELENNLVIIDI